MLPVYDIPMRERVPDYPIAKAFKVQWGHLEGISLFREKYVRLPGEIRNEITAYIVAEPHPIGMDFDFTRRCHFPLKADYDWTRFLEAVYDNRNGRPLHNEVMTMYYAGNTFEFYRISDLISWLKRIGSVLEHVQNVNFHLRVGDPTKAIKLLLKRCRNIKNLEISVEDFYRFGPHSYKCYRSPMHNARDFFYGTHQYIVWGDAQNLGTTPMRSKRPDFCTRFYLKELTQHFKDIKTWSNKQAARIAKKKKLEADKKARAAKAGAPETKKRKSNQKKRALEIEKVRLHEALLFDW